MRTLVALENSNCPWCHDQLLGALRERERVQRVRSHFSAGCLVIEHEEDPDALVSLIRNVGRAGAVAANGEQVMVFLDAHEAAECRVAKDTVIHAGGLEEVLTMASATSPLGTGAAESTARSPSDTWSSAGTVPTASIPDEATADLDMVDEWGYESFPASDPPQSWNYEARRADQDK